MIHLKCIVMHYVNLNSCSVNKTYLQAVEHAISFFLSLIYVYFNEAFVKNVIKNYHFLK